MTYCNFLFCLTYCPGDTDDTWSCVQGQQGFFLCQLCVLEIRFDSRNRDTKTCVLICFSPCVPFSLKLKLEKGAIIFQIHLLQLLFLLGMDDGMFSSFIMIKNLLLFCVSMNLASHFG